jgi:CubicO group peptidase (beta-lactamase class C family)
VSDFAFTPATASQAGFAPGPLQELRLFLETAVGNGNLPGAVVLLARGDKLVMHEAIGRGDIDSSAPLRTDAIYRLYSMTKPLTAVGMLVLYDEGKWRFDDPISIYLPEFAEFANVAGNKASREATLGELFIHSSGHGLGGTMDEIMATVADLDIFGTRSLRELVGKYARMPLRYEPGTHWEYSIAMDIQAAIVEQISGQRYDRFMEDRVFRPLGMNDTGFALSHAQGARLVPGYAMDAETGRLRPGNAFEMQETIFPLGGSSFRSTAADYARFARMLLDRGSLGEVSILKPETADLIFANRLSDDLLKGSYGTLPQYMVGGGNGFSLNGRLCIDPAAAGRPVGKLTYEWAGAHGTWFWADPEHDIVFVGLTNRALPYAELQALNTVAEDLIYRALRDA